ncbi:MAG: hypothetical protein K6A39_07820 [Clostridiales bacterium]|nr:hypothetical protein [Clostridiales bacterium]
MTEMEKRRIVVMRSAGESYKTIADMQLPVNTVKTYYRRRRLEKLSASTATHDLLSERTDGNSTQRKAIVCEVKLEFAENDDETAAADMVRILLGGRW